MNYIMLHESGKLQKIKDDLLKVLECCTICPRKCEVNRLKGEKGYCGTSRQARVASANSHFGEEPPLTGRNGSGTIFFSSCTLLCSFCQNYEISHLNYGQEVSPLQLASMMLDLQSAGCHNINFVTPTHIIPQIIEALIIAVEKGLDIPLVYNCGGYENPETLKLIEGVIDIYLPDFKFWDNEIAMRYCNAGNYRDYAVKAVKEMHRQVSDLYINEQNIAVKGLLVRHLVMPEGTAGTGNIMKFLAEEVSPNTYVNLMNQYFPCGGAARDKLVGRRITPEEFAKAYEQTVNAGIRRILI